MAHRSWSGVVVAITASSVLIVSASAYAATSSRSADAAAIFVARAIAPPTASDRVDGSGFGVQETVRARFDGNTVGTAMTNDLGEFTGLPFQIPADAGPGDHVLLVTGRSSGASASKLILVRTDWPQSQFDARHSGFNPFENQIGVGNVGTLTQAWTADTGEGWGFRAVVVSGGTLYAASDSGQSTVYAFDAAGITNCSGEPKKCSPLWSAMTSGAARGLAVTGGVVFITSIGIVHELYAFDAAGEMNCTGTPKTCLPLWTASGFKSFNLGLTVTNGVVFVSSDELYAFDAAGETNCSGTPKTCLPIWTSGTGAANLGGVAVSHGIVYASGSDELFAFDAAGNRNCSGTPLVCSPKWTAGVSGSLAVAGGVVYVGAASGGLYAFEAAGKTNCQGVPKTCDPLWTAPVHLYGRASAPAVGYGLVYVGVAGADYGYLDAFDAAGIRNCSGEPKVCSPIWEDRYTDYMYAPAVANGVVYAPEADYEPYLHAVDAATGAGLWAVYLYANSPVIVNGSVYAPTYLGQTLGLSVYSPG